MPTLPFYRFNYIHSSRSVFPPTTIRQHTLDHIDFPNEETTMKCPDCHTKIDNIDKLKILTGSHNTLVECKHCHLSVEYQKTNISHIAEQSFQQGLLFNKSHYQLFVKPPTNNNDTAFIAWKNFSNGFKQTNINRRLHGFYKAFTITSIIIHIAYFSFTIIL